MVFSIYSVEDGFLNTESKESEDGKVEIINTGDAASSRIEDVSF